MYNYWGEVIRNYLSYPPPHYYFRTLHFMDSKEMRWCSANNKIVNIIGFDLFANVVTSLLASTRAQVLTVAMK